MGKWLVFALFIFVVYYLFFRKHTTTESNKEGKESIMLECDKCGIYVANHEAIFKDGKYYCSKECASLK